MDMTYSHYEEHSDETLCTLAASGDRIAEEALVTRYNRLVRICARPFFLAGGDSEDLIQEGMFGLLKAIREFTPDRDTAFRTFAEVCIRNRLLSAVAAASRDKHAPLNDSVSFETPFFDSHSDLPVKTQARANPEDLLIDREDELERLGTLKDQLSGFEANILDNYLQGYSYQEIARRVGRSPKSVDNAVQRIRRKIAQHISSGVISES